MLYDLSDIWDLKKNYFPWNERNILNLLYIFFVCLFCFVFSFFLFHECPSDINYKPEKKGRVAAGKGWSELMTVVQFKTLLMLYDLSGIWDLKKNYFPWNERNILNLLYIFFVCLFCFVFSFFLFHECPSDINYKPEKKGRVAAGKGWSELMTVVQFKANGLC